MAIQQATLTLQTRGQGTYEFTDQLAALLERVPDATGVMHVFCQHTSCSLVIMENADPTARRDLERWMNRLVPDQDADFVHTAEGPDDMPSHIKMALTRTTETIPFSRGQLLLGTWQGVFLWEHRRASHQRRIVVTLVT